MISILAYDESVSKDNIPYAQLTEQGYAVDQCLNSADAKLRCANRQYDLLILDLSDTAGRALGFSRFVRRYGNEIPVLFLLNPQEKLPSPKGFIMGLDDYIVKPVQTPELLMRINALLRRTNAATGGRLIVGNLALHPDDHAAYVDGLEVMLTIREFDILYMLLSYSGRLFTRAQLMASCWEEECETVRRAVDVYVAKLRSKLARCNGFQIVTVRGLGYKTVLLQKKHMEEKQ